MSGHQIKILEVLSLLEVSGYRFLKIKISSFQENAELYWLIDHETSVSLHDICHFDGAHRYRLSLQTTFDTFSSCYTSFITKTYRDSSKKLYFCCTETFYKQLEMIKNCQNLANLLSFDFIFPNLPRKDVLKEWENVEEINFALVKRSLEEEMETPDMIHILKHFLIQPQNIWKRKRKMKPIGNSMKRKL